MERAFLNFTQELEAGFYLENHIIMKSLDDMEASLQRCEKFELEQGEKTKLQISKDIIAAKE